MYDLERENRNKSKAISTHQPCKTCGSSDALTIYDDGHTHCFSCNTTIQAHGEAIDKQDIPAYRKENKVNTERFKGIPEDAKAVSFPNRGINQKSAEYYGVVANDDKVFFPYYSQGGDLVACKIRGQTDLS